MNKALAVLMLVVTVAGSQEPMPPRPAPDIGLTVPEKLKCAVHEPIVIRATTTGKRVKWIVPAALTKCVREYDGGRELAVWAAPGVYEILCLSAVGDEPLLARCELTVSGTAPVPVPPLPPVPVDPFILELRALYVADTGIDKAKHLTALAQLFRDAAELADSPSATTAGQLLEAVRKVSASMLPANALTAIRRRVGDELNKAIPVDPSLVLTAEARALLKVAFTRIAVALEGVVKQ